MRPGNTMIISVDEVRKIMGKTGEKYSDDQLMEVIRTFSLITDLIIDSTLINRKEIKNARS